MSIGTTRSLTADRASHLDSSSQLGQHAKLRWRRRCHSTNGPAGAFCRHHYFCSGNPMDICSGIDNGSPPLVDLATSVLDRQTHPIIIVFREISSILRKSR